ncbi:hypothetical protein ACNJYA_11225 [Bradyrhizobium sp. DASA03068]|uniref:hypothetical protein n=1 Tax=Bradyrhizobium sp. BLXBL-01 TaxID=3395915 RepID=UPI003F6FD335
MATDDKLLKHIEALAQIATNLTPASGPADKGLVRQVINELVGALAEVHREIKHTKGGLSTMIAEAVAGASALKTAMDMAKALKDINDATIRNVAVIELQGKILSAQEAQFELVKRVEELEKELRRQRRRTLVFRDMSSRISGASLSPTR